MNIPPAPDTSQWIEPTAATPAGAGWAFFDRIYCISLKQRDDRRRAVEAEFAKIGLASRVTFFLAERHPTSSEQGIYESHQACLRAGLAAGAERIVVFEDDVFFRHFKPTVLREATEFLTTDPNWQIFFFGCFVISSKSTAVNAVRSIRYRCTAHAYVVTRAVAEQIVNLPFAGVAYDDQLRRLDTGRYRVIYPGFAFQSNSPTDNDLRKGTDRARRLTGGFYFGQRWDEFSHRNWRMMIMMHLLSIVLIVVIVLLIRHHS